MKLFAKSLSVVLLLVFQAPLMADWSKLPSTDFEVDPFPEPGSVQEKLDFEILLDFQKQNRQESCALADTQPHGTFGAMFEHSGLLNEAEIEKVEPLISKVMGRMERITQYHKGKFQRPRPYRSNRQVKPCVRNPPGGNRSYPSSHASTAAAASCVLGEVFPDRRDEFQILGKKLGDLRVVIGVHHPSDVVAGQKLGHEYCVRILEDHEFRRALKNLRAP